MDVLLYTPVVPLWFFFPRSQRNKRERRWLSFPEARALMMDVDPRYVEPSRSTFLSYAPPFPPSFAPPPSTEVRVSCLPTIHGVELALAR